MLAHYAHSLPAETWVTITFLKPTMPASLWYISHLFEVGKVTPGEAILWVYGTLCSRSLTPWRWWQVSEPSASHTA